MERGGERQPLLSEQIEDLDYDLEEPTFRRRLYRVMEAKNTLGRFVNYTLFLIIVVNVLCFILSTEQDINDKYSRTFEIVEMVTVIIFTVEYLLRLYCCVESEDHSGWFSGRIKFIVSFFSIVDLLAIVPWYFDLVIPGEWVGTQFIRVLRLFRLLKSPYSEALVILQDVFTKNSELLLVTGWVALVVWISSACFMHLAERDNKAVDNKYNSVPKAMFHVLLNMFGEFPVNDFTPWGKVVGGVVSVFAVGVAAIPTGILGAGFMDNIEDRRAQKSETEVQVGEETLFMEVENTKPNVCTSCMDERLEHMTLQERLFAFLESHTKAGRLFEKTIFGLIILNVIAFMLETVHSIDHTKGGSLFFSCFEAFSVAVFTIEFALRLYACPVDATLSKYGPVVARLKYCMRFYSIVDLLAIVPFYVDLFLPQDLPAATFMRVLRLVRMLRAEKYIEAFTVFDDVLRANIDILATTGMGALAALVIFSSLMYICERNNTPEPKMDASGANDVDMNVAFRSVPSSMWYTLLMLTGEFPLADFTSPGKWVAGTIGVLAVALFAIPTGVLGAGFEEWVQDKEEARAEALAEDMCCEDCGDIIRTTSPNEQTAPSAQDMTETTSLPTYEEDTSARKSLFRFLEGAGNGVYLQVFIFALILLNILTFILRTVDSIAQKDGVMEAFNIVEIISVVVFTAEYLLRLYASAEDPDFTAPGRNDWVTRAKYFVSFFSIVDLCAILPFYIDLALPHTDLIPTQIVRVVRLLLLLKFEQFAPALTLIDDVFRKKKFVLITSGFVTLVLWVFFATVLYLCERADYTEESDMTEAERFNNIPHSLPYTFVLLTGDYPLTEFNVWGRLTCTVMIVVAVGLVAIPSGAVAAGFSDLVSEKKRVLRLTETEDISEAEATAKCLDCRYRQAQLNGAPARVELFLKGNTPLGRAYEYSLLALIVANLLSFIYSTDEDATQYFGSSFFAYFDVVGCVVFTGDYIARVFAAAADNEYSSRLDYCTSFFGIVDLLSFAPFWCALLAGHGAINPLYPGLTTFVGDTIVNRICLFDLYRLVRLFKIEHYIEAFTVLDNVFRRQKYIILVTSFVSVIVWIACASLLYLTQQNNPHMDGAYSNMPNALFFALVALGGEWAKVDFNFLGFIVCMFMCVLAIALFGVPAGIFFGGFQEILEERAEQTRKLGRGANCTSCGNQVQFKFHLPALSNDDG